MTLRIQKDRMEAGKVSEGAAFFSQFSLTERLALANPDVIVMPQDPLAEGSRLILESSMVLNR